MIRIAHRINARDALARVPRELGVELDLRSASGRIIVHHDAFCEGEDFERWLDNYEHRLLVLNVKEDGLEERILGHLKARGVEDFFFLDQPFPTLLRLARGGESRCATRLSAFESLESVLALRGRVDWVWVDCLPIDTTDPDGRPPGSETAPPLYVLTSDITATLHEAGFRICLVSPELHPGSDPLESIGRARAELRGIELDAVCTKHPEAWT